MKKKVLLLIACLMTTILIASYMVWAKEPPILKNVKENLTIEYGEALPQDIYYYIEKDASVDVEKGKFKATADKSLLFGNNNVSISYLKEKKMVNIKVVDTTSPAFTQFEEVISLKLGEEKDLLQYFKGKDTVGKEEKDVKTTIIGDVDFKKDGEYPITVTIEDENGLKSSKQSLVKIIKPIIKKGIAKAAVPQKSNTTYTPQPTNVQSGRKITLSSLVALNPVTQFDFGVHNELANFIYQYLLTGDSQGKYKETFSSEAELYQFLNDFEMNIFPLNKKLSKSSRISISTNTFMFCPTDGEISVTFGFNSSNMKEYQTFKEIDRWISSKIHSGMSETEVVKKINGVLRDTTSYDYSFNRLSYQAIGLVRNNKGVCAGYAKLFEYACIAAGIDCQYVSGTALSDDGYGKHAWNRVKLNNSWYYIDTCWNACLKNDSYYLSKTLWSDHKM